MKVKQRRAMIATAKLFLCPTTNIDLYERVTVALDNWDAPDDLTFADIVITAMRALRARDMGAFQ